MTPTALRLRAMAYPLTGAARNPATKPATLPALSGRYIAGAPQDIPGVYPRTRCRQRPAPAGPGAESRRPHQAKRKPHLPKSILLRMKIGVTCGGESTRAAVELTYPRCIWQSGSPRRQA